MLKKSHTVHTIEMTEETNRVTHDLRKYSTKRFGTLILDIVDRVITLVGRGDTAQAITYFLYTSLANSAICSAVATGCSPQADRDDTILFTALYAYGINKAEQTVGMPEFVGPEQTASIMFEKLRGYKFNNDPKK